MPWDDAIVGSAGKLRKLWDSLSELRSTWKTTGKDSYEACSIACQNCAVYSVLPSAMTSQVRSLSLTESAERPLKWGTSPRCKYTQPSITYFAVITCSGRGIECARHMRCCKQTRLRIYFLISTNLMHYIFYNKFISSLYMFRAHVLIVRRAKLYYTVSGIITPIGVMIPETV